MVATSFQVALLVVRLCRLLGLQLDVIQEAVFRVVWLDGQWW